MTIIAGEALGPFLHGVPFLSFDGDRAIINRLNPLQGAFPFDMWHHSLTSAGARLEFQTAAREVVIRLQYVEGQTGARPLGSGVAIAGAVPKPIPPPGAVPRPAGAITSIWRDGTRLAQFSPENKGGDHEIRFLLPGGVASYTVYLPYGAVVHVGGISAEDVQPITERRPRLLAFGDSITQGAAAGDPGNTYPAIIARSLGLDHYNLGFNGCGRAEPVSAEALTGHAGDIITLHFGTNTMTRAWYDQEAWNEAFRDFLKIVRLDHSTTPVLVVTPTYRHQNEREFERKPNRLGVSLPNLRMGSEAVVKALRDQGDDSLHLIHGTEAIGERDEKLLMPDGLHPNDAGMERMAQVIGAHVGDLLKVMVR
jgi:lysophospholipase L1-like esterase